jgi:hypothetical protein
MPNQESLRFAVQVGFSSIVLCFCLFKLGSSSDNQSSALYWGGVTSVLAWWMPSPGGNSSRHLDRADAAHAIQVEKIESMPQMNRLKN